MGRDSKSLMRVEVYGDFPFVTTVSRRLPQSAIIEGMRRVCFRTLPAVLLLLYPAQALALQQRGLVLLTGVRATLPRIIERITVLAVASATFVCTAIFLYGAFHYVAYANKEDQVKTGKDIMIGSLVGLAVIYGAYGILRTVWELVNL
ncbi:MAG: hypothetical protein Greene041619_5 [Candidatus Peregrinibacteria bacterium Greene0416_19]|nr:MAG: hypothetical protein Greene041619_5 [Candidatus Peregrinibacteria bacterium Greene0416_19]